MRALYVSTLALSIVLATYFFVFQSLNQGASVQPQVLASSVFAIDPNEKTMIEQINTIRRGVGVDEVVYSNEISGLTDYRVTDMVSREYYSHKTPDNNDYANYLAEYGVVSAHSCENLQLQVGSDTIAAIDAWVSSPAHYRCVVDPRVNRIAISYGVYSEVASANSESARNMFVFAMIASN